MTIRESDFILRYLSGGLFDLKLLVTKKKKDGTIVPEEEVIYGCSLFSALRRIIINRIRHKNKDGAISISTFRRDLISEMNFLHDIFEGFNKEKDDGLE